MADNTTVIGKATRVRGRLTGKADVDVQGFIEGEITVSGDVTVDSSGIVDASVRGRRLLIRGAVRGDLLGEESVTLADGARVVGDIRAPRVAIALGALARGSVETVEDRGASPAAARVQSAARPATSAGHRGAPAIAAPSRAVAPSIVDRTPPKTQASVAASVATATASADGIPAHAGPRRAPLPVVPSLKKAKAQILKKRER
jgi:cytoskeletal protein CcmA (bactofilin family)